MSEEQRNVARQGSHALVVGEIFGKFRVPVIPAVIQTIEYHNTFEAYSSGNFNYWFGMKCISRGSSREHCRQACDVSSVQTSNPNMDAVAINGQTEIIRVVFWSVFFRVYVPMRHEACVEIGF